MVDGGGGWWMVVVVVVTALAAGPYPHASLSPACHSPSPHLAVKETVEEVAGGAVDEEAERGHALVMALVCGEGVGVVWRVA